MKQTKLERIIGSLQGAGIKIVSASDDLITIILSDSDAAHVIRVLAAKEYDAALDVDGSVFITRDRERLKDCKPAV